jgi:hypothetical protein
MKTRVLRDDYREIEIRPAEEFNKYLSLIEKDIKEIFKSSAGNYFYYCPACTNEKTSFKFSKNGFVYRECNECETVFMTPRPNKEMLHEFFENSEGLNYWNSKLFQNSVSRKEHIFKPRVRWIQESLDFDENSNRKYLDFYSKYSPFIKQISKITDFTQKISYKPIANITDELTENNFETINEFEGEKYSVVTTFEVFDRFYNPRSVLESIKQSMEKGGLLFLSTTSASGLDFQYLLNKSKNLIPPIHLNIFSVEGIIKLLEDFDFEVLELSTPGSLDLKNLENEIDNVRLPKFLNDIIQNRDSQIKQSFQEYLQRARLSSHMRILAKSK